MRGLTLFFLMLGLFAGQASTNHTPWVPIFKGIERCTGTNNTAYNNGEHVIQALRIDLQDPDVRIFTTPPVTNNWVANSRETLSRRPDTFLKENNLKVAINGAHYGGNTSYTTTDGANEWIHGLVISQGQLVSPYDAGGESEALMYFTSNKVASFIATNFPYLTDTNNIWTAIPGMFALVDKGVNLFAGPGGPIIPGTSLQLPQPRTAIGYSQDGRYLILLVIDGRQSDSDGAVSYETADWLIRLGAYYGMNLDGGGSTCMVMANECGDGITLNDPSIQYAFNPVRPGWKRSVGHNIGIAAKSLPGSFIQDPVITPGRSMALLQWDTAEPSSTQVEYGPTVALGSFSLLDPTPRSRHQVLLSGLSPGQTNYFRLISATGQAYTTPTCFFVTQTNPASVVTPSNVLSRLFGVTQVWAYTSNNLDGIPWTQPGYNQAGWQGSGPGLLHVENSEYVFPKNTLLPTPCDPMPPDNIYCTFLPRTYYFRTTFNFPTNPAGVSLVFTNWIDDGAVFYLNGREIYRLRMPPAPNVISNRTLASGFTPTPGYPNGDPHYGDAIYEAPSIFNLTGPVVTTNLIQGTNLMAVEVHNYTAGSPDIVFGTELYYSKSTLPTTNALVVAASDLALAVPMTITPTDNYGEGNGLTPFERMFFPSATANVTAPLEVGGRFFQKWRLDGADFSTNPTVAVEMSANHLLVAVYGVSLTVHSQNPTGGVSVAVSPADNSGSTHGSTPASFVYEGGTAVTLTAPAFAGPNYFVKWLRNGGDFSTNTSVMVDMDTNHVLTAVYATPQWTLSVESSNPNAGVAVAIAPNDVGGLGAGATPLVRTYEQNASVTVAAPRFAGTNIFQKWMKDGTDFSTNLTEVVVMDTNLTLTAVYTTPTWRLSLSVSNADGAVTVQVTPNDLGNLGGGELPLDRAYRQGTPVTITAPATSGTNVFQNWIKDGAVFTSNLAETVVIETNLVLTAVYAIPQWTLSLIPSNPVVALAVEIEPADAQGNTNGIVPLSRVYQQGAIARVTAPAIVGTNHFAAWILDGATVSNLTIQVTMDTNHTLAAWYVTPVWTLLVHSENPATNVAMIIEPLDQAGHGDGITPLTRSYWNGSLITLTAPAFAEGNQFQKWQSGGADLSTNQTLQLTLTRDTEVTALYLALPPEPPLVNVLRLDDRLIINWTNAGFTLQQVTNFARWEWGNVPGPVTNGPYTNLMSDPAGFFRLKQ